jgi:hypothetical protein
MREKTMTADDSRWQSPSVAASRISFALLTVLVLAGRAVAAEARPASAQPCAGCKRSVERSPRTDDQHWLINTRCLGCPAKELTAAPKFGVWRYAKPDGWSRSNVSAFLIAQSPRRRICVYLHGARTRHDEAVQCGFRVQRALTKTAPADEPLTFVTWSWPTSPAGRPLRDLRCWATRSDVDACYLAWLLSRLDAHAQVTLVGFSYGARASTGAMHLLAGGKLMGRWLPQQKDRQRRAIRAVLWTPAVNNDWLLPRRPNGRAVECLDRMVILYNPCDRAMRHYHWVAPSVRFGGMGFSGLASPRRLGAAGKRIEQYNVSCRLGRVHSFFSHVNSPWTVSKTREVVWGE